MDLSRLGYLCAETFIICYIVSKFRVRLFLVVDSTFYEMFKAYSLRPLLLVLFEKITYLKKMLVGYLFLYISLINVMNQIELCIYIYQSNIGSCYFLKKHTKNCFEKRSGQVIWDHFFFSKWTCKRGQKEYFI